MTVPFSQTSRALQGDGALAQRVTLAVVLGLLVAWGAWLVVAELPLRIRGTATLRNGRFEARFPPEHADRLASGQPAMAYVPSAQGPRPVPLHLVAVGADARAELEARPADRGGSVVAELEGPVEVEVEVGRVPPWELVRHALRR